MTQRSQLTGDPFEDFFNNLGNFQSPQEPQTPPTQSGGSYGGGGYGQNNNRGGGQDPRQARPQKPKGLLEEFGINVTEIARKGILTLSSAVTRRLSVSSKFSTVEPRTTRF